MYLNQLKSFDKHSATPVPIFSRAHPTATADLSAMVQLRGSPVRHQGPQGGDGLHVPLVVETYGGWHPQSEVAIKTMAMRMAAHTKADENETTRHVFQRLAIILAKENVALLERRSA